MARPKRVFRGTIWQRLKVWLSPGKMIVGVDYSEDGDLIMYGKFINGCLYITKVEYGR